MNTLGLVLTIIACLAFGWPEGLGRWIATVRDGYIRHAKKLAKERSNGQS